jgi:hypothetical protein
MAYCHLCVKNSTDDWHSQWERCSHANGKSTRRQYLDPRQLFIINNYVHLAAAKVGLGDRYIDLLGNWREQLAKGLTT